MGNTHSVEWIRAATGEVSDAALERLLHSVYVGGGFTAPEVAASLLAAPAVRERGELIVVKRTSDGALLGMVIMVPPTSAARKLATDDEAEMHLLAVDADARGHGLGTRLVEAALVSAKAAGCNRMVLWTQPTMHAAQGLYARSGFLRVPDRDWQRADRAFWVFQKAL
jgi:ribosomal protein S18 acetylase RimI-like enzyme